MHTRTVVALIGALLLASSSAQHVCRNQNVVSVTGAGRRSFKTSIAVIRLGVEASGKTAQVVQRKLARDSTRLTAYLKRNNVQKLTTSGVSLFAQRNFKVTPAVIVGYRGSNTVSFEVPVERAGAILDGAVANGASQISGISFKATPVVTAAARKAAIRDAVRNARTEAEVAVEVLRKRLGAPREIKITDTFVPQAQTGGFRAAKAVAFEAAPPTSQISGGEESVTARVSITFAIY